MCFFNMQWKLSLSWSHGIYLVSVCECEGEAAQWSAVILLLTSLSTFLIPPIFFPVGAERQCPVWDSSPHQGLLVCPRFISQLLTSGWCSQYAWGWRVSTLVGAILMAAREGIQRQNLCSKTHREWQIYLAMGSRLDHAETTVVVNQCMWQYPSFAELQLNDIHTHPYFSTQTHLCKPITLFSW